MNWIPVLLVAIPLLWFVWQSVQEAPHTNTLLRFFQFGEPLKGRAFLATLLASNSGLSAAVYLFAVYGYWYGLWAALWSSVFWILTQQASVWTIRRVETLTAPTGFLTVNGTLHEFLGRMFHSRRVRIAAASLSFLSYVGLVACEILLAREIIGAFLRTTGLHEVSSSDVNILTFIIASLVAFYTAAAGFRAVIRTDIVQLALMIVMLGAIWAFIFVFVFNTGWESLSQTYFASYGSLWDSFVDPSGQGPGNYWTYFVVCNIAFWAVWWPVAMDQWHRCAATQLESTPIDSVKGTGGSLATLYLVVLSITFVALGVVVRTQVAGDAAATSPLGSFISLADAASSATYGWQRILGAFGVGLICSGLIAAALSTMDTYLVVACQSLLLDLLAPRDNSSLKDVSEKSQSSRYLAGARLTVVLVFALICFLSYVFHYFYDIYEMIYFSFCFMLALVPVVLMSLLGKATREREPGAFASLLLGMILSIGGMAWIVYNIEQVAPTGDKDELLKWYNYMYAWPELVAAIAFIAYFLCPRAKSSDVPSDREGDKG